MIHIMMASYQGAAYIRKQLDSIQKQTRTDWKLFIQDDGSTDGTGQVIEEYCKKDPDRIQVFLRKPGEKRGAKYNFASLFDKVPRAEYYMFCDQDDIWEPDKLEILLSKVQKEELSGMVLSEKLSGSEPKAVPVLAYCDMKVMDQEEREISGSFSEYSGLFYPGETEDLLFRRLLGYNFVTGSAMLFNHALRKAVRTIPEKCFMHDWWLSLAAAAFSGKLIFVKESLQSYRQHEVNVLGAFTQKTVREKLFQLLDIRRIRRFYAEFRNYQKNNQKMKLERLEQCRAFYWQYGKELSKEHRDELKCYMGMLVSRQKFRTLVYALRTGYVLWSRGYTVKFYLL